MLDPTRHDLPESVLNLIDLLRRAMEQRGVTQAEPAALQLASQIIRQWGGIQAYVAPPNSRITPRIAEEIGIWAVEGLVALGLEPEDAYEVALGVCHDFRQTYASIVLYLPKDRWTFRRQVSDRFTGHNQVDLCREFNLTTANLYQIVFEERSGGRRVG